MFASRFFSQSKIFPRFVTGFKRTYLSARKGKRVRVLRSDMVTEQVRKVLQETDQKLILMVRG